MKGIKNDISEEKNKGGRPSKIDAFTDAFDIVVNEDNNAIDLTEEELVLLTNDKLEEKERIHYNTFRNYKRGIGKDLDFTRFLSLYKKAFLKQKKSLLKKLRESETGWQRFAWLLERKEETLNKAIIDYKATREEEQETSDNEPRTIIIKT
ncbi:hypothetical protein [uncultured Mediterranean phage uvMED]|nr:hypothetical protein [uncultured Mediterranean phage uvMED]